ncbi:MAG TPA: hypothetical protein EYP14_04200, partial [Planctomycetaceae bacterium]|nr:hypothetical protein [Planctomycetaceae bacterium]
MADVGSANYRSWGGTDEMISELHINGQKVERPAACYLYHTAPVDIAPYLKPGRNCVGFFGSRIGHPPFLYFQARIVMEGGEVIRVATGPGWKYSPAVEQAAPLAPRPNSAAPAARATPGLSVRRGTRLTASEAAPGWDEPGFDDSNWQPAKLGRGPDLNSRDAARRVGLPADSGRLVMKVPKGRDLFFRQGEPVVIEVHVPPGLQARQPALQYALGRANEEGRCVPVVDGTVSRLAERDGSLVYRLELGQLRPGVYGLALALKAADGTLIERRPREPLVVVPVLKLKKIDAAGYTEGLDLELEDTIDFTDPADPHPWFESRMPPRMYGSVAEKVTEPV